MSLSSDVAGMRKGPQRQKTMTPISQEPKGLEPRGCEGDKSLGASSFQGAEPDGCREGGFS